MRIESVHIAGWKRYAGRTNAVVNRDIILAQQNQLAGFADVDQLLVLTKATPVLAPGKIFSLTSGFEDGWALDVEIAVPPGTSDDRARVSLASLLSSAELTMAETWEIVAAPYKQLAADIAKDTRDAAAAGLRWSTVALATASIAGLVYLARKL